MWPPPPKPRMAAAEPTHVASAKAHVAKIPAGEMSPAAVKAVTETRGAMATVETGRIAVAEAAIVRRVGAAPAVIAGIAIRPVVAVATIRIAGSRADDAANNPGRDGRAGLVTIAVDIAAPVSPNVMAQASAAMSHITVRDVGCPRMRVVLIGVPRRSLRLPRPAAKAKPRRTRRGRGPKLEERQESWRDSFASAAQQRREKRPLASKVDWSDFTNKMGGDHDFAWSSLPQSSMPRKTKRS